MKTAISLRSMTIVTTFILCTAAALGDGFRNPPESASALGRSGGKYAHIDDASAATINPANMTDLQGTSVLACVSFGYGRREFDSPCGAQEETEHPWSALPSVFAVWPIGEGDYVAGLGVTVPFGRSSDYGSDALFGSSSPYYAEQWVVNVNPSIATKLTDDISVAIGASVYQSDLMFKQLFPWSLLTQNPADPSGIVKFEGSGVGYGANAAATWTIGERHKLALVYRSAFDVNYEGDFEAGNMPDALAGMGATSTSDFETEIKYPAVVAFGYGVQLTKTIRVGFDVEWIEHSRNDVMDINIGNNQSILQAAGATTIPQDWDDNWTYGVGADWQFSPAWIARAGFIYLETPTSTRNTLPVASEENQSVASVGLGYRGGKHGVDMAYAIGFFNGLTVNDNVVPATNGDYDFESHVVSLAYSYTL